MSEIPRSKIPFFVSTRRKIAELEKEADKKYLQAAEDKLRITANINLLIQQRKLLSDQQASLAKLLKERSLPNIDSRFPQELKPIYRSPGRSGQQHTESFLRRLD